MDCECELVKLLPRLEDTRHKLDLIKTEIITINRERQRGVWGLITSFSSVSRNVFILTPGVAKTKIFKEQNLPLNMQN